VVEYPRPRPLLPGLEEGVRLEAAVEEEGPVQEEVQLAWALK
jgi:hypothetical protein